MPGGGKRCSHSRKPHYRKLIARNSLCKPARGSHKHLSFHSTRNPDRNQLNILADQRP